MAWQVCKECGCDISDKAALCPHCGVPVRGMPRGYEYRSEAEYLGLPLLHIAYGVNPQTGRPRIAKGIIAVGNVAFGVVALGGLAFGGIAFGGVAAGVIALAGVAFGALIAAGGLAVAGFLALGGAAIGHYSLGGLALGPHALGGNARSPEAIEFFEKIFGEGMGDFFRRR